MGLQVFLQATGEEVGRVADVFDGTGTHDVLRIQLAPALLARLAAAAGSSKDDASSEGEEEEGSDAEGSEEGGSSGSGSGSNGNGPRHVLLPFAKALVPVVDLEGGRMEITPPEGLLELAAPSQMRRARRENRGKRERRRTRPRGQAAGESTSAAAAAAAASNGNGASE